jgi:hypothetical protein
MNYFESAVRNRCLYLTLTHVEFCPLSLHFHSLAHFLSLSSEDALSTVHIALNHPDSVKRLLQEAH